MKTLKLNIVIFLISLMTVACSKQTRTNTWDPSVDEVATSVQNFLAETDTQSSSSDSTAIIGQVTALVQSEEQQGGVIYYAESGKTGHASSVASILDFSIFDLPARSLYDVQSAKVLLLDLTTEQGREFTLIFTVELPSDSGDIQKYTAAFKSTQFTFTNDLATIDFGKFILSTYDLSDEIAEDFAGIVKFEVEDKNGVSFGQFSSMIGFGN